MLNTKSYEGKGLETAQEPETNVRKRWYQKPSEEKLSDDLILAKVTSSSREGTIE